MCIKNLFFYIREKGIKIINLELKCGHVIANIDERMFHKQSIPEYNTVSSNTGDAIMDTSAFKQTSKSKSVLPALKKQMLTFPDKVSLPKYLSWKCLLIFVKNCYVRFVKKLCFHVSQ